MTGAEIRAARKRLALTQEQLAERKGLHGERPYRSGSGVFGPHGSRPSFSCGLCWTRRSGRAGAGPAKPRRPGAADNHNMKRARRIRRAFLVTDNFGKLSITDVRPASG